MRKIERRKLVLALLLAAAFTTAIGGLILSHALDSTNGVDATTSPLANTSAPRDMDGMRGNEHGFGRGWKGCESGLRGDIEVSSEYTQKVNNILGSDDDVKNLTAQGYNMTSIRPQVKSVVAADGSITTKASTATVIFVKDKTGYATVNVDVIGAKVTKIVIITRTVIDKSAS